MPSTPRTRRAPKQRTPEHLALRRLRTRWALYSIIPVLAAVGVVVFAARVLAWNETGLMRFDEGKHRQAVYSFKQIDGWAPIDKWVATYNLGTTNLDAGAYLNAINYFEQSEKLAPQLTEGKDYSSYTEDNLPPFCKVRHNHISAYEQKGDDEFASAAPAWDGYAFTLSQLSSAPDRARYDAILSENQRYAKEAITFYEQALESYDKGLLLSAETTCPDLFSTKSRITGYRDNTQNRLDQLKNPVLPPPPPESSDDSKDPDQHPDNQPQDPGKNSQNNSEDPGEDPSQNPDDPNQDPSQSPSDPTTDPGSTETDAPTEGDEKLQQLQDRNKKGAEAKEQTEGAFQGGGSGDKQW